MFKHIKKRIIVLAFIFFGFISCIKAIENFSIKQAQCDLSAVNFNEEVVQLSGETLFIWNQLDSILSDSLNASIINNGFSWNNQPKDCKQYGKYGCASYFFSIRIAKEFVGKPFVIEPNHFISYTSEIFINNKKVCSNGTPGSSKHDSQYLPSRKTTSKAFIATSEFLNVSIQVANYHHFRGGIFKPITIGLASNMHQHKTREITYELFIIVSLLIMFLYHMVSFFIFRKNYTALFFSITCLFFALDLSMQNSMCFFLFFPETPFQVHSFLHLVSPFVLPAAFMFFFHSFFPEVVSKKIRNITGLVALVCILILLSQNNFLISSIVKPHYLYIMLVVAYIYYASIKAVKKKLLGAYFFISSYLFFSLFVVNDLLNMFELVETINLMSLGMMIFVFFLSIMQASVNSNMYNQILELTNNLKFLNENLENEVERKTGALNKLLKEEKHLKQFQRDMSNMLVHDLKGPLNTVINVKQIAKDDPGLNTIQQAGYQMNNLVMNMLDIYKYDNTQQHLKTKTENLVAIFEESYKQIEFLAKRKNITVFFEKQQECLIKVDKNSITRIVVNLLMNATKYSPTNDIINIEISPENTSELKVSISNNGPFIPFKLQDQIFKRFVHSKEVKEDNIKPTGLGLSYCKLAIEAHKGKIGVDSAPGKNVKFWFTLPNLLSIRPLNNSLRKNLYESLQLSKEDKKYLHPFCELLNNFEVYDISAISKAIDNIKLKNKNTRAWKAKLENSVEQINEINYKQLLAMVLHEKV